MLNYLGILENATGVLNQAHVLAAETASGVRSPRSEGASVGGQRGGRKKLISLGTEMQSPAFVL